MQNRVLVGIVMGSDSDLETMQETMKILEKFGIGYEVKIMSAHRSPQIVEEYALSAEERGLEVIIAAAGGAAHLPGMIAAWSKLPVIGVPIQTQLGGLDSLLSIVQMPSGVPVATVSVGKGGAKNSAVLAVEILGIKYPELKKKLKLYKEEMAKDVEEKNKKLKAIKSPKI
ncbi:MAG: 5-(carboxyamino)imidazole ribonucleotide mutase [Candidatus Omnitrophica bacterium]|nr:5-(carboxyamino)imidazole ribonucleotide mutase [Candidatus Omnitrophota bacterium]